MIIILFLLQINADAPKYNIPNIYHGKIAIMWIEMHNTQDKKSINSFIKENYSQTTLKKINTEDHINFYYNAAVSFGQVDEIPFEVIENTNNRLVIHFVKKGVTRSEEISPENIFVVEIDMNLKDPTKLERGLGLGALICSLPR